GDGEKNFRFQRTPRNAVLQRHAVQKLHDEERMAVLLPDLMDRADIGMVEGGSSAGFAAETFQCLWVLRYIVREKFKGDKSTKRDVLGLIDHSHAAATELAGDLVVGNSLADHWNAILGRVTRAVNRQPGLRHRCAGAAATVGEWSSTLP